MANPSSAKITDLRVEQMVSLSPTAGGEPTLRVAQFLAPSVSSFESAFCELQKAPLKSGSDDAKNLNGDKLKVNFPGWRTPRTDWKTWVDRMHTLHHSVWRQAGIYDAIMNSTYRIHRNEALIFAFAERWRPITNTFLFPWGEATVTLEDVMIIGGFPVLGDPVFSPIGSPESEEVAKKLLSARKEIQLTKARKASQRPWLQKFMDTGSEVEHEAFLAFWLSRFVFPTKSAGHTIGKHVLPIAIHLARGTKIALAPAVLANVYANLTEMKQALIYSSHKQQNLELSISAPFELVQIWVWERFSNLQPKAITIEDDQPRFAKWNDLRMSNIGDVKVTIDEAADYFHWRPYTVGCKSLFFPGIYRENAVWISVAAGLSEEQEILVRWLRTSELVGMDLDCIEQYLPHRVAMQFGFDQDVPGQVARANSNGIMAWESYTRKISDATLYVPSRLFACGITTRYKEWWKKYVSSRSDEAIKTDISRVSHKGLKRKMSQSSAQQSPDNASNMARGSGSECKKEDEAAVLQERSSKRMLASSSGGKKSPNEPLFPPGFPPKPQHVGIRDSENRDEQHRTEWLRKALNMVRLTGSEYKKSFANPLRLNSLRKGLLLSSGGNRSGNDALDPPGFQPRRVEWGGKEISQEDNLVEVPVSVVLENATLQNVKEEPIEMNSKNEKEKESSKAVLEHGAESSRPGGSGLESGNSETPFCHQPLSSGSAILTKAGNKAEAESDRNTGTRKCCCSDAYEVMAIKLEARITKLERIVARSKTKHASAVDDDDEEGSA